MCIRDRFNIAVPYGPDQWGHMAYVIDGGTGECHMYVDGFLSVSGPNQYQGNDAPFILGNSGTCWFAFEGLMDEIRVYDRALTHDEIVAVYRAERDALGVSDFIEQP